MGSFMIEDFKNINEKLDTTDKKMYNAVILYLTFFGAFNVFDSVFKTDNGFYSISISIFVSFVSFCMVLYSFAWRRMRRKYLADINVIRTAILNIATEKVNIQGLCLGCYPYCADKKTNRKNCIYTHDYDECNKFLADDDKKSVKTNKWGMTSAVITLCLGLFAFSASILVYKLIILFS